MATILPDRGQLHTVYVALSLRGIDALYDRGKAYGKIPGMATVKITVTVPRELAEYIRNQVASGAYESVSAFLTAAAESARDLEPLDLLIASMVAETGEPDEKAQAWAAEAVGAARRARQRTTPSDGGRAA
jgi:Arc/MetJ-type ribon-helix-helix transcriptional regulator